MGENVSRAKTMDLVYQWLIDGVSRALDRDERDAVCGDFSESGITGSRALRDLLGLIVRRQVQLWADWRPWLALAGLVAPVGMLLSVVSRNWAVGGAIYGWLYVDNWTWGYLASSGARADLARTVASLGVSYLALVAWAWTTGFALGSLSRRAVCMTGPLFCIVVFAGTLGTTTTGLQNPFNAAVFSVPFYRVVLPVIIRAVLVVLPALWGMGNGSRLTALRVRQAIVCLLIVAALTALTARGLEGGVIFGWVPGSIRWPAAGGLWAWRDRWPLSLLPLVMVWPAAYMLAASCWRRHGTFPIHA
jgi:hypothetical protein